MIKTNSPAMAGTKYVSAIDAAGEAAGGAVAAGLPAFIIVEAEVG